VGSNPRGIGISPLFGNFAYVANRVSNSLSRIDTATNTVVATTSGVGVFPEAVVLNDRLSGGSCESR